MFSIGCSESKSMASEQTEIHCPHLSHRKRVISALSADAAGWYPCFFRSSVRASCTVSAETLSEARICRFEKNRPIQIPPDKEVCPVLCFALFAALLLFERCPDQSADQVQKAEGSACD